jgi:hypothetical protein
LDADASGAMGTCESVTGSRIRTPGKTDCSNTSSAMKTFTAEELQATGEIDMNKALRTLDPSIR